MNAWKKFLLFIACTVTACIEASGTTLKFDLTFDTRRACTITGFNPSTCTQQSLSTHQSYSLTFTDMSEVVSFSDFDHRNVYISLNSDRIPETQYTSELRGLNNFGAIVSSTHAATAVQINDISNEPKRFLSAVVQEQAGPGWYYALSPQGFMTEHLSLYNYQRGLVLVLPYGDAWPLDPALVTLSLLNEMLEEAVKNAINFRFYEQASRTNAYYSVPEFDYFYTDTQSISYMGKASLVSVSGSVPEPGTLAVFSIGLMGLYFAKRRKT